MAAQDYNTISQPALGVEANSLSLVVKKEQKKQQRELAHLATILKAVEEELASAKAGTTLGSAKGGADVAKSAAPAAPANSEGPSNTSLEDALSKMAGALQLLQVEIAKYANKKANTESKISEAERNIAEQNLKKANKALKKLQHELAEQKKWGFWERLGEALAGVVLVFIAAVTEQPELLIAAALLFAGAAGLISDASNELAKMFEAMGLSSELSNILSGITVTLLMVLLTAGTATVAGVGTGAAAAADAATDASTEGMEMTEMGADAAEDATEEATTNSNTSRFMKVLNALKKLNPFRLLGARANLAIMAGTQSAAQTKVIDEIAAAIAYDIAKAKGDKKNAEQIKKEVEMITGIIVAVMSLIASIGSGAALAEGATTAASATEETTQEVTENASFLRRLFGGVKMLGISSTGQRLLAAITALSELEVAGTGTAGSVYTIKQGEGEIILSEAQADTILNKVAIDLNNNTMQSSQQFIAQQEKSLDKSDSQTIMNLMKGEEAFAQLLSTSMV